MDHSAGNVSSCPKVISKLLVPERSTFWSAPLLFHIVRKKYMRCCISTELGISFMEGATHYSPMGNSHVNTVLYLLSKFVDFDSYQDKLRRTQNISSSETRNGEQKTCASSVVHVSDEEYGNLLTHAAECDR